MSNRLASIIIPTYNHKQFIVPCIESCLKQTYPNVEVIVIDDGSTDGTKEILSLYFDKITYKYQKNQGLSAARNTGLKLANGSYIQFLDADDSIYPEKISKQVDFLEKNKDCIAVFCNCENHISKNLDLFNKNNYNYITSRLAWCNFIPVHAFLCKKNKLLFKIRRTSLEDWEYWFHLTFNKKVGYINKTLCFVNRSHSGNMSSNLLRMTKNEINIRFSLLTNIKFIKYWPLLTIKLLMNIFGGIPAGILKKINYK